MGVLQYPTALAVVQDALLNVIALGFGKRSTAATLAALAAIPSRGTGGVSNSILDKLLCFVTAEGAVYRFSQYSTATADGSNVIQPDDATGAGRWLLTSTDILNADGVALSAQSSGYIRRVMLWAGERSEKVWKDRILGQRPAVVLQFLGEDKEIHSNQRGNLTNKLYHFALWGVSQNLRPDLEGEKGSPITSEATADPGVARMMGDLEYLLDGLRGVDIGVDGLDYLIFGATEPGIEDYSGREFVWTAPLDVRVTIGKEDPPTRYGLAQVFAQPQLIDLNGQASVDSNNYVAAGLTIATGAGFTKTPASGIAFIQGSQVTVSGSPAHTFTANRATYRDLYPDGSWVYLETWSDDTAPPVTPGAMRIAVTFTDFTGVTDDRFLVATKENIGPATEILLPNGVPDNRVFFGVGVDPGSYTQAFVETTIGGQGNDIDPTRQRMIDYDAGASDYCWYIYPSSYGGAASNFIDTQTQIAAGFAIAGTVDREESSGAVVTYTLWRSEQAGLGALTVEVT